MFSDWFTRFDVINIYGKYAFVSVGLNASNVVNEDYLIKASSGANTLPAFSRLPTAFSAPGHRGSPYSPTGGGSGGYATAENWQTAYATAADPATLQYSVMSGQVRGGKNPTNFSAAASLTASKCYSTF